MSEENNMLATEEATHLKKLPDLKALREERGLSIEDIFLKTRINTDFLNAIENGDFHLLPPPLYARKFIGMYAETIGIDAGIILAHYQRHVDQKQAVPEELKTARVSLASDRGPSKRYLWYAVPAVAVVAALVTYAFLREQEPPRITQRTVAVDEQKEAQKEVAPAPAPVVKEPPPETANTVTPTPLPLQTPPPAITKQETGQPPGTARLDLLVEATEETWLNIVEDRKSPSQVTLKPGEKLRRTAREFFIIDVGNAAGVAITFQGKSLGNLGRKGQVVHLRLPQQSKTHE